MPSPSSDPSLAPSFAKGARAPAPLRWSRALRLAALVLFVALLVYVASVAYSATELRSVRPAAGLVSEGIAPNDTAVVVTQLQFANPSFYAIGGLGASAALLLPSNVLLASAVSPPVTVGPAKNVTLELSFQIPVGPGTPGSYLVSHSATLPLETWVNGTYGILFTVAIHAASTVAWSPPSALRTSPVP